MRRRRLRDVLEARKATLTHADAGRARPRAWATRERLRRRPFRSQDAGAWTGLELVQRECTSARPQLPLILMTAHGTAETAIDRHKERRLRLSAQAVRDGCAARRVLEKPSRAAALATQPISIGSEGEASLDAIIGQSRAMQDDLRRRSGELRQKPVSVLIRGRNGNGQGIDRPHHLPAQRLRGVPFIAVNCVRHSWRTCSRANFAGYESRRGAFTGAEIAAYRTVFEQAHTGTILFSMKSRHAALPVQVKLLRFLQSETIERVGGRENPFPSMSASSQRPTATWKPRSPHSSSFAKIFSYRLNVVTIHRPPGTVPARRRHPAARSISCAATARSLTEQTFPFSRRRDRLSWPEQPWPGNVRELENVLRKALLSARGYGVGLAEVRDACAATHLSPAVAQPFAQSIADLLGAASRGELQNLHATVLADAERELLAQAIKLADGNQAKAARWLGIFAQGGS